MHAMENLCFPSIKPGGEGASVMMGGGCDVGLAGAGLGGDFKTTWSQEPPHKK